MTLLNPCSSTKQELLDDIKELKYLIKTSISTLGMNNRNVKVLKLKLELNNEYLKIINKMEENTKKILIISQSPLNLGDSDHTMTYDDDKGYQYELMDNELPRPDYTMEEAMKFIKNTINNEGGDYECKKAYNELVTQLNLNNI